jgi:hypothetical protein
MDTQKLRNVFHRYLCLLDVYENCDKSDINDLEIQADELNTEILNLLKD